MRNRSWTRVLDVAGVGLAVTGVGSCGDDGGRAAVASDLEGRLYIAVEADAHRLVADREAMVAVGDGVIDASGGCNPDATVAYALRSGRLEIRPYFAQDLAGAGCRDDIEQQDAWLQTLLRSRPTMRVSNGGQTLVVRTADEAVTFEARTRPEGRRVVPRADLDRFHLHVETVKANVEARQSAINAQIKAGRLTRAEGRARVRRLHRHAERSLAAAAPKIGPFGLRP